MKRPVLAWMSALIASACANETKHTRALVEIRSNLGDVLSSVGIEIRGQPEGQSTSDVLSLSQRSDADLLVSFAVAPTPGTNDGSFFLKVTGLDESGNPLVERREFVRFVPHRSQTVRVWLDRSCVGVTCDSEHTCSPASEPGASGECKSIDGSDPIGAETRDSGAIDGQQDSSMDAAEASLAGPALDADHDGAAADGDACAPGRERVDVGTTNCAPSCASDSLGCQPGDSCLTDADCKTGDPDATCDPSDRVCVTLCGPTTIVGQLHLDAAKFCREIDGDLKIEEPNLATIEATALPYLNTVRGDLFVGNALFGAPAISSITISNLQSVDGDIQVGYLTNLRLFSLPRLGSAGALGVVNLPMLVRLSLPQLRSVSGALVLGELMELSQLDLGRLTSVGGELWIGALCKLPWSQVQPVSTLGTAQNLQAVGCCTHTSDLYECLTGNDSCNTCL